MGAAPSSTRICPECGTPNSGISLFCSECGASLTNATLADEADSQATAAFRPVSEDPVSSDPFATREFQPASTSQANTSTGTLPRAEPVWVAPVSPPGETLRAGESGRGLVLGWIAGVLILLVIGYLGWTSYLDPDTRDSIIGFFT